jgi:hypothetical protein
MAIQDPPRMHESMILYAQLLEARNRARRWFFINLAIAVIGGLLSLAPTPQNPRTPRAGPTT